jgi:hypothetical protein
MISPATQDDQRPAAFCSGGDGDDIVEAHHHVGNGDDLNGLPEIVAGLDVAFAVRLARHHQFDRDPQQQQPADQLEIGHSHDRGDDQGENDAQQDGGPGAENHAPEALARRQRPAGERDHHRVVARENDVDQDDLPGGRPKGGIGPFHQRRSFNSARGLDAAFDLAARATCTL